MKKEKRCKCGSKKMYKNCCGKQAAKNVIKAIGQNDPDPADDPNCSIETIAEVHNAVVDYDLELPMLTPRDNWEDHMDFDRNAVKLGYSNFVRPMMKSDAPRAAPNAYLSCTHVIVGGSEYHRTRMPINLNKGTP